MGPSPTQVLAQQVCQKYGWSSRFEQQDDGRWACYVTVGIQDTRRFASAQSSSSSSTAKEGMAAAAQAALDGLQDVISEQESKPQCELSDVFAPSEFLIKGSSHPNWKQFIWSNKPSVVGIDTEGNQSCPPVLVQIATQNCVLLEITSMNNNQLSQDLERLLNDDSIVKVFCDNFAHHDKHSLGLLVADNKMKEETTTTKPDYSQGSIVDLEVLASKLLGPVKVARGLSRIVTLTMPELNVIIGKPPPSKGGRFKNIGRFTLIEQGKLPPIKSLRDLSRHDQQYAALDAWATLQAYKRIEKSMSRMQQESQTQQR